MKTIKHSGWYHVRITWKAKSKLTAFRERLNMSRIEFYGLAIALLYFASMLVRCIIQHV